MSRTNDVNIAMQYAKSGVDGVHLMDSHKATIGWVVNTLAAEVERLEAHVAELKALREQDRSERIAIMEVANIAAEAAEARVKELEVVRDALIRSEESAHQMEELLTNQAQEYIERAEAAEQRAEESERAFGLLEEAHKATTAKFAEMMQRVKELEALEPKRAQFDSDHCMHVLVPHDKYEQMERAETRLRELQAGDYEKLEAQNARLRAALEDVSLLAHCISKAGPLNTPDLETAWRKFDLISVKAAEALVDRKAALNSEEAST